MASKTSPTLLVVGVIGVILVTGGVTSGIATLVDGTTPASAPVRTSAPRTSAPATVEPAPVEPSETPSASPAPKAAGKAQQQAAQAYEDFYNHFYNYPPALRVQVEKLLPGGLPVGEAPQITGTDAQLTQVRRKLEKLDPYFLQIETPDYDSQQDVLQHYATAVLSRDRATGDSATDNLITFTVDPVLTHINESYPGNLYASINAEAVTVEMADLGVVGAGNLFEITNTFHRVGNRWVAVI